MNDSNATDEKLESFRPDVTRLDKYTLSVGGWRVQAGVETEQRIRSLNDEQLQRFIKTMGG